MRLPTPLAAAAVAAAAALSGCDHGTVTPTSGETLPAQMADFEVSADDGLESVIEDELAAKATATRDETFTRTVTCPVGGDVVYQGERHSVYDTVTRILDADLSGSRTVADCAFLRGPFTITVSGGSKWEASRHREDGVPVGPQTTHHAGSYGAVRSDGEARSCAFDVDVVRDPAARTRTVDGTVCGVTVHRVTTWSAGG